MAKINLLPWREAQRQELQRNFIILLVVVAIVAGALVLAANQAMNAVIEGQEARNNFLRSEIRGLDREIARIEDLERTRDNLISRKNVIERLQENRSLMVHLFNQIAQTVPEGITLNSVRQTGMELTIVGTTESETRVSDYMRRIERASWLHTPRLRIIQVESRDARPDQPFRFELRALLGSPRELEEEL
ncbi:MAG: pilus assembly protein PilN [Wenzhouxiangella sp.]|nr:MAG: pilus assembly protein PilN [Wenzhouxiangella sp.]